MIGLHPLVVPLAVCTVVLGLAIHPFLALLPVAVGIFAWRYYKYD